ncbi:von Willebrand factor-like isoform X2 [Ascaphus truei]|uniref:von Willebrand factor-like isoform X2 n=1 Tax=Ascaphus truei TaxID=8439 RepID=UPI003F5AA963
MLPKSPITLLLALMLPLTLVTSQSSPAQTRPICFENEQYYSPCKPCPESCRNEKVKCEKICKPGCSCKPGYVLSSANSNNCISPKQCINCTKLEVFDQCSAHCQDTCDNYLEQDRPCTLICKPGCVCQKGLVRHNNTCIPPSECPKKGKN